MGWWLLRLAANILAFLRLTVNFFSVTVNRRAKINFHCFKKLKKNYCCNHIKGLTTISG